MYFPLTFHVSEYLSYARNSVGLRMFSSWSTWLLWWPRTCSLRLTAFQNCREIALISSGRTRVLLLCACNISHNYTYASVFSTSLSPSLPRRPWKQKVWCLNPCLQAGQIAQPTKHVLPTQRPTQSKERNNHQKFCSDIRVCAVTYNTLPKESVIYKTGPESWVHCCNKPNHVSLRSLMLVC